MTTKDREPADRSDVPLPATERVFSLDVLRGAALLGIFIMNMPAFSHSLFAPPPATMTAIDTVVTLLRELLFAGKFNLLFGFVFGIGFTWQLERLGAAEAVRAVTQGRPADRARPLGVYARRLAALLAIGLVHAVLLWPGDVLVVYAVLGFGLLAIRRANEAVIVALLAACLVLPALGEAARPFVFADLVDTVAAFQYQQLATSNDAAFGDGSFFDAVVETARVFAFTVMTPLGRYAYATFFVQMATGILAGVVVGRRWRAGGPTPSIERLRNWQRAAAMLVVAAAAAMLVVAVATGLVAGPARGGVDDVDAPGAATFGIALVKTIGYGALAALYALTIVRVATTRPGARWLRPLAAAGRMPLTNYLLQTLLASFVCYGWGLGLWGQLGALEETLLAISLFGFVQLPASLLWLTRFSTGPIEMLWRWLTYRPARAA